MAGSVNGDVLRVLTLALAFGLVLAEASLAGASLAGAYLAAGLSLCSAVDEPRPALMLAVRTRRSRSVWPDSSSLEEAITCLFSVP